MKTILCAVFLIGGWEGSGFPELWPVAHHDSGEVGQHCPYVSEKGVGARQWSDDSLVSAYLLSQETGTFKLKISNAYPGVLDALL